MNKYIFIFLALNLESTLIGMTKQQNEHEEKLKEAWERLKLIQTNRCFPGHCYGQETDKAKRCIIYAKKALPEGRADQIIKELEDSWNNKNQ